MRIHRSLLVPAVLLLLAATASGAGAPGPFVFIADTPIETAAAISTGADVVYGGEGLHPAVIANRSIYEIGKNRTQFDTVPISRLPGIVNASPTGRCPEQTGKQFYAAMVASLNQSALACIHGSSPSTVSLDRLKHRYIDRIAATGDSINHVIVTSQQALPVAAAIAADQHALVATAGPRRQAAATGTGTRADGFEDGTVAGWRLRGEEHGVLEVERSDAMHGNHLASVAAAGTGSKQVLTASRTLSGALHAGQTLHATLSFSHRQGHVPKLRYRDAANRTNFIQVRFDPPGRKTWCKVQHGDSYNRSNFADASSPHTVYGIRMTLGRGNITCTLQDRAGDRIAATTLSHPPGFTYASIDRVEVESLDGSPVDIRFDNVTYRGAASPHSVGAAAVNASIRNATQRLAQHGMYLHGRQQYTDGLYLSLIDVPAAVKKDPVEAGSWSLDDPKDGTTFPTDLAYADFNQDGRIDAGVGRYPANRSLASRMYLRSKYYTGKQALVASEYLHANWPTILLYVGGGMFTGKSVEQILERQGYSVSRAVEYRASPEDFLIDLTPVKLGAVVQEAGTVQERIGAALGESVGTAASQVFTAVKALQYIERTLEQYLEFDWSTAGLDIDRARQRLSQADTRQYRDAARAAAEEVAAADSITDGIVDAVETGSVQEAVAKTVYAFFWPDRYGQLTGEQLTAAIPGDDLVYYNGVGNRSAWVLPNNASTVAGIVRTGRYNGSDSFTADQVPQTAAAVVFDNADMAAARDGEMREAFLQHGAAAYVGASTVNYAPFSSEIGTRFFTHGATLGGSLQEAVNRFRQDSITWDPANMLARNNVKGKMLRSFRLYGNPEMAKDPEIGQSPFRQQVHCRGSSCTLTLTADVNTTVRAAGGTRTLSVHNADGYLLESFHPIIPLLEADHVLPASAAVQETAVQTQHMSVRNMTVPGVTPLSHGGQTLRQNSSTATFPRNVSVVRITDTVDGRTRVSFTHAAFQYDAVNHTATVFDRIALALRYRTPLEMAIEARDTTTDTATGTVTVWNRGPRRNSSLLLHVRRRNSTRTRTVNTSLPHGKTRFNVSLNVSGAGRRGVDAYLFTGNTTVGPRTDTFAVRRSPVTVDVDIPGTVDEGEQFDAVVTVTNRHSASPLEVQLNGSNGIQGLFLRPLATTLPVPRGRQRSWRVPLRAFTAGNGSITARTSAAADTAALTVRNVDSFHSAGQPRFQPASDGFQEVPGSSGAAIQIVQPRGHLRLQHRGSTRTTTLVTKDYRVQELRGPGEHRVTVKTGNSTYQVTAADGSLRQEVAGVDDGRAAQLYELLQREKQRLLERYRIARRERARAPG